MKVIRGKSSNPDQPLTNPFPIKGYFFWEFRGGDWLQPMGKGDWFKPPYFQDGVDQGYYDNPTKLFFSWSIPFLNWRGYFGANAFGVDAEVYKEWLCDPAEVYDGSYALMKMSIRPFARIRK